MKFSNPRFQLLYLWHPRWSYLEGYFFEAYALKVLAARFLSIHSIMSIYPNLWSLDFYRYSYSDRQSRHFYHLPNYYEYYHQRWVTLIELVVLASGYSNSTEIQDLRMLAVSYWKRLAFGFDLELWNSIDCRWDLVSLIGFVILILDELLLNLTKLCYLLFFQQFYSEMFTDY